MDDVELRARLNSMESKLDYIVKYIDEDVEDEEEEEVGTKKKDLKE